MFDDSGMDNICSDGKTIYNTTYSPIIWEFDPLWKKTELEVIRYLAERICAEQDKVR